MDHELSKILLIPQNLSTELENATKTSRNERNGGMLAKNEFERVNVKALDTG